MMSSRPKFMAAFALLAVLGVGVNSARSESVTTSTVGVGTGLNFTIHTDGTVALIGGGSSVSTNGHQFSTTFHSANSFLPTGSSIRSFCVDLARGLSSGTHIVADVSWFGGTSVDANGNSRNIGSAGWVVRNYGDATLAALQSLIGDAALTQAEANTALQISVWSAAYTTLTTIDTVGAKLWFTSGDAGFSRVVTLANTILGLKGSQTDSAGFVNYPPPGTGTNSQEMLFSVPEPSSLVIAGLCALGMVSYGVRRGRQKVSQRNLLPAA